MTAWFAILLSLALGVASHAGAAPLDAKAIAKRAVACGDGRVQLDALGDIVRAEPIGRRPVTEVVQLFGTKGRAYVFMVPGDHCYLLPVKGKPSVIKGSFAGGATVAYGLVGDDCMGGGCPSAVSFKSTDDKLVDVLWLGADCTVLEVNRIKAFTDHDSVVASCYGSGGADVGRSDFLLEVIDGKLTVVAEAFAGIAWYQGYEEARVCHARPPGRIDVVSTGPAPVLDLVIVPYDNEAQRRAAPDWQSGGCEQTVVHQRATWDATSQRFALAPKVTYSIAHKICHCEPRPPEPR